MYSYLCPHLRLFLLIFSGMYSYFWMWPIPINAVKWTFFCCFVCLFVTSFHSLVHCCLCIWYYYCFGRNIFYVFFRIPETCVSRRQTSRILWITHNFKFLEVRWTEQHPEFVLLFSLVLTWEYLVLSGHTQRILSHRHAVSRDKTTCAWFHLEFLMMSLCSSSLESNRINSCEFSDIIEVLSFDCPFLFLSSLSNLSNSCPSVRPYVIWTWCRLDIWLSVSFRTTCILSEEFRSIM